MYKVQYKVPLDNEGNWGWATAPREYPNHKQADRVVTQMRKIGWVAQIRHTDEIEN